MKNVTSYFLMGAGRYAREKSESGQLRKSGQIRGHIAPTKIFTALANRI